MSLSNRLKHAMKSAGYTQTALAKKIGIAQQLISKLLKGESRQSVYLSKIEAALGVPQGYLLYGDGETPTGSWQPAIASCPLLKWDVAAKWPASRKKIVERGLYENMAKHFLLDVDSYVLQIDNDSMQTSTNTDAPYFKKGSYIIVDPHRKPKNLDFVLAKTKDKRLLFRQYKIDDQGRGYLFLLNERYPQISIDIKSAKICGVVVMHFAITI